MTNTTTVETIKVLLHLTGFNWFVLFLFLLLGVYLLWGGILTIIDLYDDDLGFISILLSIPVFAVTVLIIVNSFVPLDVTKTTSIQKESPQIVQVEGKLLSSNGLTLFLKDGDGNYKEKKFSVDDNIKIKEGNSYSYTQVKTKISYNPKQKIRAVFSQIPRDQSTIETILIVPKGTLAEK